MQELLRDHGTTITTLFTSLFGPAAATWLVLKVRLNGAKEDIQEMKSDLRSLTQSSSDQEKRLFLIESMMAKFPCVVDPKEYWRYHRIEPPGG